MAIPFTEFNDIKLRPEEYNQDLGINRVANQMLKNDKANVKRAETFANPLSSGPDKLKDLVFADAKETKETSDKKQAILPQHIMSLSARKEDIYVNGFVNNDVDNRFLTPEVYADWVLRALPKTKKSDLAFFVKPSDAGFTSHVRSYNVYKSRPQLYTIKTGPPQATVLEKALAQSPTLKNSLPGTILYVETPSLYLLYSYKSKKGDFKGKYSKNWYGIDTMHCYQYVMNKDNTFEFVRRRILTEFINEFTAYGNAYQNPEAGGILDSWLGAIIGGVIVGALTFFTGGLGIGFLGGMLGGSVLAATAGVGIGAAIGATAGALGFNSYDWVIGKLNETKIDGRILTEVPVSYF